MLKEDYPVPSKNGNSICRYRQYLRDIAKKPKNFPELKVKTFEEVEGAEAPFLMEEKMDWD